MNMEVRTAKKEDMQSIYALRFEVFVSEQGVPPEIELDSHDAGAIHIIADESGEAIGCARIILSPSDAHIGRLAVRKAFRGKSVGASVCKFCIQLCRERGYSNIWLNAQLHARGFYERLGFIQEGESFCEAGIEHIKMRFGGN